MDHKLLAESVKLCLKDLKTIENPIEYLYEVNQVLNRFKTNIFNIIKDPSLKEDPKEAIQFTIKGGAKIKFNELTSIESADFDKTFLYVNGTYIGKTITEINGYFNHCVCIDDVFDTSKISKIKGKYFNVNRSDTSYVSEQYLIETYLDYKMNRVSISLTSEKMADDVIKLELQINGIVYDQVLKSFGKEKSRFLSQLPVQ
jgi:hypothetical protein